MKITAVTATPIALPLEQPFHWRSGVQEGVNLVLFAVETDEGMTGLRRVDLRGPRRRRVVRPADGARVRRPLARRHRGDLRRPLARRPLARRPALLAPDPERDRVGVLGRARQGTRRAGVDLPRRARPRRGRLHGLPAGGHGRGARARGGGAGRRGASRRLHQGRSRAPRRRGGRRRRARRDRARAAAARRPERGVGRAGRGRRDPAARGVRPRLGRAARGGRQRRRPRAGAALGRDEDRRRPGGAHDRRAPRRARAGGRGRDRARQPRVGRPLALAADGVPGRVLRDPDEPARLPGERALDLRRPAGDGLHPEPDRRQPGHASPDHRAAHDDADRDRRAAGAPCRRRRGSASRSTWTQSSGRASAYERQGPY